MKRKYFSAIFIGLSFLGHCFAQGRQADYERAHQLRSKISKKLYDVVTQGQWDSTGKLFLYEKNTATGREFVLLDADARSKSKPFDLEILSDILTKELSRTINSQSIPTNRIKFISRDTVEFEFENDVWSWHISGNKVAKIAEKPIRNQSYWGRRSADSKEGSVTSPDAKFTAYIKNNNVYVASKNVSGSERQLTFDGSPGEYYSADLHWASDSKKVAGVKVRKADTRILTLLESSPLDQLQPKLHTRDYAKPGDALSQYYPFIANLENSELFVADKQLIDNQYANRSLEWRNDSRSITFEYNKRGHQQYAVVELNATTGQTRYLIDERSTSFIDYSGKRYRFDIQDGREIIWASERDGWNHLYRYDGTTGAVINQITKGDWVVRKVIHVDQEKQQILFEGSGYHKHQDPYLIQYFMVNFDGSGFRALTNEDGSHQGYFNKNYSHFVDVYSRIDEAPKAVLRDRNGKVMMEIETADEQSLLATGWRAPEVFTAKGRDGQTAIWGIIIRPTNFDPSRKYPVIEYIYAGPHSSFVPKTYIPNPSGMQELAELGFIVVQVDGMGTSNRSKAFHDICWQNLKDAGFPDRISWMKAAAAKYPYMDLDKVGIYGTSAGGQSSTGALLFHPDFYKVGVSSCGCHDNRMDKIWWNEQWMGWPIGPQYAACSNIENAGRLEGKLMLIVGEMDDNVDPASTYQLSNALIKAHKDHEMILVPGMGHSSGGEYGERKRKDFFVKHLLGIDPPNWSEID